MEVLEQNVYHVSKPPGEPKMCNKAVVTFMCCITLSDLHWSPINMAGQVPFHLESFTVSYTKYSAAFSKSNYYVVAIFI
jgi:hypothetical protein